MTTTSFSTSIWRPLVTAAGIGVVLITALIWAFVEASAARQSDAAWVEHTNVVLRSILELDRQLDDNVDPGALLAEIQRYTADNESQQRRLAQLQPTLMDKGVVHVASLALRAEEQRLSAERVATWRDNGRARDWFTAACIGLIILLGIVTLLLIVRVMRKRERNVEFLALNAERVYSALPETAAYEEVRETMAVVREALRKRV